jgi:hydrogenase maturation protease
MRHTLVICIGNKARGDDGVARDVAERLEGRLPSGVELISAPQLDVVVAEDVSRADAVVFADAERRADPAVQVAELSPDPAGSNVHALDPAGLLALAERLYGRVPEARLISIAAPEMGHGEGLSETARAAAEAAACLIASMLGETEPAG